MKKTTLLFVGIASVLLISMGFVASRANASPVTPPYGGGTGTSTLPALGSLLVGLNGTQYCVLAVGTNGMVPIASSSAPCGVVWGNASGSGGSGSSTVVNGVYPIVMTALSGGNQTSSCPTCQLTSGVTSTYVTVSLGGQTTTGYLQFTYNPGTQLLSVASETISTVLNLPLGFQFSAGSFNQSGNVIIDGSQHITAATGNSSLPGLSLDSGHDAGLAFSNDSNNNLWFLTGGSTNGSWGGNGLQIGAGTANATHTLEVWGTVYANGTTTLNKGPFILSYLSSTQCLHEVNGVVLGTGSDCGSGSGATSTIIGGTGISAVTSGSTTTITNTGVTSFTGANCVTSANSTGTITLTVTCLSANQSITWTGTGDATGTGSGATSITVPMHVVAIQGKAVTSTAPTDQQYLKFVTANGDWEPASLPGYITSVTINGQTGTSFVIQGTSGDVSTTISGTTTTIDLANVGSAGSCSWCNVTFDAKGRETAQSNNSTPVTSLTGTIHQVNVSASTGAVTVSTPQNIDTTSTPTFGGLTVNGNTTSTTGYVSSTLQVLATTTIGNCTGTNCQLYVNSSTYKTYVGAGTSTVATTVGGALAYSATSTGGSAGVSTTLETYTMPTSTLLTVGDEIDIYTGGTIANSAGSKQIQIAIASTTIFDSSGGSGVIPINTAGNWFAESRCVLFQTTSTRCITQFTDSANSALTDDSGDAGNTLAAVTTTIPIAFNVYGLGTAGSDVIGNYFRVMYDPF